jgi:hypothetical protein
MERTFPKPEWLEMSRGDSFVTLRALRGGEIVYGGPGIDHYIPAGTVVSDPYTARLGDIRFDWVGPDGKKQNSTVEGTKSRYPYDVGVFHTWALKRTARNNPDPRLRAMERTAETPDELAAYAAARRRAGETVDPWELVPVSYVFLQAFRDLGKYYKPGGLRQAGASIPRVTGRVEAYRDPVFLATPRAASLGPPRCGYARCHVPASWRRGDGKLTCGNHPGDKRYLKSGGKKLPVGSGGTPQRFYVAPNPYPLLAPPQVPFHYTPPREDEIRYHMEAIEEWRRAGAIVVELDFTDSLAKHAPNCGKGGHSDGMGGCTYCDWIDAYKWRVLTSVEDVRNALGQSGWYGGRGVDVLIPAQWDWARIMQRKGKGPWKNNPGDEGLRRLERRVAEEGSDEAIAALISARLRSGQLTRKQVQDVADLDYEPALMVMGKKRRGAVTSMRWWNARGHRFAVTVLTPMLEVVAHWTWGLLSLNEDLARGLSDRWWSDVGNAESTYDLLTRTFHPMFVVWRAQHWLAAGAVLPVVGSGEDALFVRAAAVAGAAALEIQEGGTYHGDDGITESVHAEARWEVAYAAEDLLLCMTHGEVGLGNHAKAARNFILEANQRYVIREQHASGREFSSLHQVMLNYAIPRLL